MSALQPISTRGPAVSAGLEIVVQLADGADGEELGDGYGAVVVRSLPELNLVVLAPPIPRAAEELLASLQVDSSVVFAETNVSVYDSESLQGSMAFDEGVHSRSAVVDQEALRQVRALEAHDWSRGRGTVVAILDTGIDLDHPNLRERLLLPGIEAGTPALAGDDRAEFVDTNRDGVVDGSLGHGTHVSGIVNLVAPEAWLLPVRVLDSDGVGNAFDVAQGIVAATLRGASILNMSLGLTTRSRAVEAALDFADARGVLVVAPAGNSNQSGAGYPSSYGSVLSVTGLNAQDSKASFSNYGAGVDVAAPALGILSTYVGGATAAWSGTSMAAPFVAGTGALLRSASMATPQTIRGWILEGARDLRASDPTYGAELGSGRVDALSSVLLSLGSPRPEGGRVLFADE